MATDKRRISRGVLILLEVGLAVAVVYSIYWWRTHDLLPLDDPATVPSVTLTDLAGEPFRLDELGGRPAVLYFFAPWCSVCNASAHQLRWFHSWFGDEVDLVMVALDWDSIAELEDYKRRHGLEMPVLLGDSAVASAFRVRGYPTYYVLDREGRIVRRDFGVTTMAGLWWRTFVRLA